MKNFLLAVYCGLIWLGPAQAGAPEPPAPPALESAGAPAATNEGEGRRIPYRRDTADTGDLVARVAVVFVLLIGIAGAGLWAARSFLFGKAFPRGAGRRIELVEVRRLTPRSNVVLVRVDGRLYLLGQAGDRLMKLDQWPAGYSNAARVEAEPR